MVESEITDGRRIAELLASEIDGRDDDELAVLSVTDADRDAEPAVGGTQAYTIEADDGTRIARVFLHPERIHIEFDGGQDVAIEAAARESLRTRPKATTPPKTLVFLERGADVKRGVRVVQAAVGALEAE